jgi:AraC-like DNA-binding protein
VSQANTVEVRFHPPPEDLRRFLTTFYLTEIEVAEGGVVTDALQPEWANLRFFSGEKPDCWIEAGDHIEGASFVATGPSTRCTNFRLGKSRLWGMGLLPLGWAQFIRLPAADHANLVADGQAHPSFGSFAPLAASLFGAEPDETMELDRLITFFRARLADPSPDAERIFAIHAALVDPQVASVAELVDRVGVGQRTVERLCRRAFGFPPKLLLRRQRFMRSLSQFMLDPSLRWIGAIDSHYHDQAQFVRDFREFMGMTPREYAARPHPVLEKFIHERARVAGAPVQTMDRPEGVAGVGFAQI